MLTRGGGEAPYCMMSQTTTPTSMGNSVYTAVTWDTILDDRWKMLAGGAGTSLLTVPKAGLWICDGAVEFAASAATPSRRFVALQYTAAQWRGSSVVGIVSGNATASMFRLMKLKAGDTIALAGFQDTGGALNTAFSENASYFNMAWLRP